MFKTILHPTDFSSTSELAFGLALSLARDHGGRVIVLHVAAPPSAYVMDEVVVPPAVQDLEPLRKRLAEISSNVADVSVERRLVEGDAADEILREAETSKCDLIVLGTHGRQGISRLIMGSVAEQVIRRAQCNVVVAKTPSSGPVANDETTGGDQSDKDR